MSLPVAILCGGKGTRLGELTKNCPKSLVDVCGEPFIAHQLRLLAKAGLTDVVLLIGHLGEQIRAAVGDGSRYGVRVRYSEDGPEPLGTFWAVRCALPLLGEAFFVLYGDVYLECNYEQIERVWRESGRDGLMVVYREGGVLVDAGVSVLTPRAATGQQWGPSAVYESELPPHEIGSAPGLAATRLYLKAEPEIEIPFSESYLDETTSLVDRVNPAHVERMAESLAALKRRGGRLFVLGNGGSAANASHAVNDFRKISGIEAYCPTDNVAELTARANDEGWPSVFVEWLKGSQLTANDAVLVLSVGGGSEDTSPNLVRAVEYAKAQRATILGIVGRDGGYTARVADCCVIVPTVNEAMVTAHVEAMQGVILHLLANHPALAGKAQDAPQKVPGKRKAVFLDKDGTLVDEQTGAVLSGVKAVLPGVKEALKRLKDAGYLLIVVTNQPDIARGKISPMATQWMRDVLQWELGIDAIYICPHDDADACQCRKPKPGMLLRAEKEHDIDLAQSWMVGDSWRDVEAGRIAGCRAVLIAEEYDWRALYQPTYRVNTFKEAVEWILTSPNAAAA